MIVGTLWLVDYRGRKVSEEIQVRFRSTKKDYKLITNIKFQPIKKKSMRVRLSVRITAFTFVLSQDWSVHKGDEVSFERDRLSIPKKVVATLIPTNWI